MPDVLGPDKLASETVPGMRRDGVVVLRKAKHREILGWISLTVRWEPLWAFQRRGPENHPQGCYIESRIQSARLGAEMSQNALDTGAKSTEVVLKWGLILDLFCKQNLKNL